MMEELAWNKSLLELSTCVSNVVNNMQFVIYLYLREEILIVGNDD